MGLYYVINPARRKRLCTLALSAFRHQKEKGKQTNKTDGEKRQDESDRTDRLDSKPPARGSSDIPADDHEFISLFLLIPLVSRHGHREARKARRYLVSLPLLSVSPLWFRRVS